MPVRIIGRIVKKKIDIKFLKKKKSYLKSFKIQLHFEKPLFIVIK